MKKTIPSFNSATIKKGASFFGIALDDVILSSFSSYFRLIEAWNSRVNLVSENDLGRFAEYHILDALKILPFIDLCSSSRVIDFGSGSGIPGIPLALSYPHLSVVLVESRIRRCEFLDAVCSSIPVPNATVLHTRIENLDHAYDSFFDVVVTRATTSLSRYYDITSRFVAPGGCLVAIKGEEIEDELFELQSVMNSSFQFSVHKPIPFGSIRTGHVVTVRRL